MEKLLHKTGDRVAVTSRYLGRVAVTNRYYWNPLPFASRVPGASVGTYSDLV